MEGVGFEVCGLGWKAYRFSVRIRALGTTRFWLQDSSNRSKDKVMNYVIKIDGLRSNLRVVDGWFIHIIHLNSQLRLHV